MAFGENTLPEPFTVTVAAGGGGGSVMAAGLLEALGEGYQVNVVVPTGDSGGGAGVIRDTFGGPAVGDVSKVLSTVGGNEGGQLFGHRYDHEATLATVREDNERMLGALAAAELTTDRPERILETVIEQIGRLPKLQGQRYGNLVLNALRFAHGGDIVAASEEAGAWVQARARVIPITAEAHTVIMEDGAKLIVGEDRIDGHTPSDPTRAKIHLLNSAGHRPTIARSAYDALASSDLTLLGPGSTFTSQLPILLVRGTADALAEQRLRGGRTGSVLNLVHEKPSMAMMGAADYVNVLSEPLGEEGINFVVVNDTPDDLHGIEGAIDYRDTSMTMPRILAIGARLVGTRRSEADPNDHVAAAGQRSEVEHNVAPLVKALRQSALL